MAYLTIDDAPSPLFEEKLDYLASRKIPAIFFCEGRAIAGREEALLRALSLGYLLGNHSFSHPHFSELPIGECRREIGATDRLLSALYAAAGLAWERRRFRFPYLDGGGSGDHAAVLQEMLRSLGYAGPACQAGAYADTRCSFDQKEYWLGKVDAPEGLAERSAILGRIGACGPREDDVILIHDHENTHELFFECIERYRGLGIGFGSLR
jgi:peptidoglycan-N-acetylglucosamine deacetylase